jgi:hypothetical protein
MATSAAAYTILNTLDQTDSSVAAVALSQDALAHNADSEPISDHSPNRNTPRKSRAIKRVRWQEEAEEPFP